MDNFLLFLGWTAAMLMLGNELGASHQEKLLAEQCRDVGRFTVSNLSYICDNDMVIVDGEPRLITK